MCVAECGSLVRGLLQADPANRIKLPEVEKHVWITKSGRYLFTPYVPPLRDQHLRHVVRVTIYPYNLPYPKNSVGLLKLQLVSCVLYILQQFTAVCTVKQTV